MRLFKDIGIPKADNGNYLWIQYFYHYLNEQGRAGFVMASSATDAGNTEKKPFVRSWSKRGRSTVLLL
ncbi:N-6 DNA methylase [Vibrio sinaloensis]|nr:N-6 DNA methylase [Vibrio sinaloensis]